MHPITIGNFVNSSLDFDDFKLLLIISNKTTNAKFIKLTLIISSIFGEFKKDIYKIKKINYEIIKSKF